ncbi:MAG TPA: hypothetical protein VI431_12370 [Candidatus Acidoferrum sp.]
MPTAKCSSPLEIPALNALALCSLVSLLDEKAGLFSRSLTLRQNGFQREATSPRRTIIALLGLHRLKSSGETLPFDVFSICEALLGDTTWVKSLGDLGLLTWFTAECEPDRLRNLFTEFNFAGAIDKYWDGRQAQTVGLAWFLAGIAHARLTDPQAVPDLIDVAVNAYRRLEGNQGESGIFGHAALPGFLQRTFCRRFGTFSDQIYSIYALVAFARAFQVEEPLESALNCGNAVRALQGELGQWWFLYDKATCRVVNRYPVLSLHQTGTAPVGLLALGEATGQGFNESICKGLSWIMGANELGHDLRRPNRGLISGSIRLRERAPNYWEAGLSLMNIYRRRWSDPLTIEYEVRPDQLGWFLYAFGRSGLPKAIVSAQAQSSAG